LLNSVLTVLGVTVMMLSVSALLTGITVLIVPLAAVVSMFIGKRLSGSSWAMWDATAN
jgi:ATP-binding cassette subfamily B protein